MIYTNVAPKALTSVTSPLDLHNDVDPAEVRAAVEATRALDQSQERRARGVFFFQLLDDQERIPRIVYPVSAESLGTFDPQQL